MKLDEDLGPDRGDEFQTDDEENQAERVCGHGDDTESDGTGPSQNHSDDCMDIPTPTWPQSYRRSMDIFTGVTPPSISFLRTSSFGISSSLSSAYKRHQTSQTSELDSSLSKPLISDLRLDEEEVQKSSIRELPPPQQQSSFSQAILNGVNVLCGIGLLTIPYAVKQGGWLSLSLLFVFGIICCYTGILMKRCLESSPGLQTYPDIGQAAFGAAGRIVISITLYIDLYATCVELVIMASDNLSTLFPNSYMNLAGIYLDPHQIFAITATLIVLPTVWLRDLSLLSYLSVGGVLASILVVLCLLWVGVVDQVGFHPGGTPLDLANLSVSIGIYGFGYAGHTVFPNIYSSMKEPSKFPIVLIASFIFCWFMYMGVAICGFLMFGDSIDSQFTLNMPQEFVASKIAVWTVVVNPLTKYALTLAPVALSLEELIPSSGLRSRIVSIVIRTILVISTLVVALTVPFFGFMMALIGSLLAMLVAFIFPCACYLSICKGRLTKLQIAACVFIMVVGFLNACVGTYSALTRIVDATD